ncbi:MAG: PQQ-binding-like beta-propeller repeat protein [Chloroflexota bacterium]
MEKRYIFTWKAIAITFIFMLSAGLCLASIQQTSNLPVSQSDTVPTRTPDSDTVPTRTPKPTETAMPEPTATIDQPQSTETFIHLPVVSYEIFSPVNDECGLIQEAENGELFGNMIRGSDSRASGSQYIYAPSSAGEITSINTSHRADYCFDIEEAGSYIIRGWVSSENIETDSFFVTMDGIPSQGYLWETHKSANFEEDFINDRGKSDPQIFELSAGRHTLSIYQRENSTRLDRFEILKATEIPSATATPSSGGGGDEGGVDDPTTPTPQPSGAPTAVPSAGNLDGWPMAGANVERTSAVADGVNPRQQTDFGIRWYRPLEAYIGQHVQLIAAREKIYAATARGLYALNAETGAIEWRFDTEMPLGHSPTVDGNRIFVGGFDKRVYGLNADTGALLWTFSEAQGGFSTNPVVVNNQVLMGSRDGRFYSLNGDTGQLNWQYPPADQDPLGPILYSAAYKDGRVYFASNDNHGYALDVNNGALVWKSGQMPGDGYQAFWPVIYNNYVIFSSAPAYVEGGNPGTKSIENGGYGQDFVKTIQRDDVYPNGASRVNGADVAEYLENKPWRRGVIVLNTSNGQEHTFDSDNDGRPEYAPFMFVGTKSGNRYPPLVINDGLYAQNMSQALSGWSISRATLSKWEPGSPGLGYVGISHAIDEPFADSAAGEMLYTNLCCDRVAGYTNLSDGSRGEFWNYNRTLETTAVDGGGYSSVAPGYDVMWWESSMYSGLPRLTGAYGGPNGIYHNHSIQNPLIPYKNNLYVHRSNAIIMLGPNSPDIDQRNAGESVAAYENRVRNSYPDFALPLLSISESASQASVLSEQDVQNLLDAEIEKMIEAGPLRPGYYNGTRAYDEWVSIYENPGETLYTLVLAYPEVSPSLQPQLKAYIDDHYNRYFATDMYTRTGYQGLAAREWMPIPPEVQAGMDSKGPSFGTSGAGWSYPQFNLYAMWKYAELFYANDATKRLEIYQDALSKLDTSPASGSTLEERIWLDNGYIAGYTGFLELQSLAGQTSTDASVNSEVSNQLNTLLQRRASTFSKDQPFITVDNGGEYYKRSFNVARNFIYLTPELGEYLRANAFSKVSEALEEYDSVAPYWVSTRYEATIQEMSSDNLQTHSSMFKAKAFVMNESKAELRKYIDSPAFAVGDLIYIQNLAISLGAE